MKEIKFVDHPEMYNPKTAFMAHLHQITNEEQMFEELKRQLKFPDYFGANWNSVSDCLRDFHWIKQNLIVLVHDEIPLLNDSVFRIYIQILKDAIHDWEKDAIHKFEVVFSKTAKHILSKFV